MTEESHVIFVSTDETLICQVTCGEPFAKHIKIHLAKSETEALQLLSLRPEAPVLIMHQPPNLDALGISRALVKHFPKIMISIMTNDMPLTKEVYDMESNILMILPKPESSRDLALFICQGLKLVKARK